jgi:hypothetical protein
MKGELRWWGANSISKFAHCRSDMDNGWIGTEFIKRFTSTKREIDT